MNLEGSHRTLVLANISSERTSIPEGLRLGHYKEAEPCDPNLAPISSPTYPASSLQCSSRKSWNYYRSSQTFLQQWNSVRAAPLCCSSPRKKPNMRAEEDHLTTQMMMMVEASTSPWSSPVVLARKKDGTMRFSFDYQGLNYVTINDAQPLPCIDELLESLSGANYFSTLDLQSRYTGRCHSTPRTKRKRHSR